jgi:hypothetical protein
MKKSAIVLIVLSILVVPFSFAIAGEIGEQQIYGLAGMMRYMWIMWLMTPIGIASIMLGLNLKKRGLSYKGSVIVGGLSVAFLILIGSYSFLSGSLYDDEALLNITNQIGVEFPENTKAALTDYTDFKVCIATITPANQNQFESYLRSSNKSTNTLDPVAKNLLPDMVKHYFGENGSPYELFIFLDLTTGDYNTTPAQFQETPCVFLAYDCDTGRILTVSDYIVDFS